jgi:hypothetical protein
VEKRKGVSLPSQRALSTLATVELAITVISARPQNSLAFFEETRRFFWCAEIAKAGVHF